MSMKVNKIMICFTNGDCINIKSKDVVALDFNDIEHNCSVITNDFIDEYRMKTIDLVLNKDANIDRDTDNPYYEFGEKKSATTFERIMKNDIVYFILTINNGDITEDRTYYVPWKGDYYDEVNMLQTSRISQYGHLEVHIEK